MSDRTIGLKLPTAGSHPDRPVAMSAGEWGVRAEELGYDSLWVSEAWGANAVAELTEIAVETETIRPCTAVLNVYSRTPAVLAMAGATLQRLSDDRAVLGVGPSHAGAIEAFHGMSYDRPVRRTHEAIELVKELTGSSSDVAYHGEVFDVEGLSGFDRSVPVYNAALGEANRRATGRVADGWLPYMFPISAFDEAFETIAETAREADRDPDDIEVTPQILAAVSDDVENAKDVIRTYIARYVGRFENYRNALANWYPEEARAIGEQWEADGLDGARAAVTDELVFELGVAGTPDDAREQLRDVVDTTIADCPIVYVPREVPPALRDDTIEALSPDRL